MKNNGYKYNHFLQKGFVKNFAKNGEVKWKKYKTEEGGVFHINNTPNKDQPIAQEYFHSLDIEKGMNTLESQGLQVVRKIAFEANQKDEISLSRKELLTLKFFSSLCGTRTKKYRKNIENLSGDSFFNNIMKKDNRSAKEIQEESIGLILKYFNSNKNHPAGDIQMDFEKIMNFSSIDTLGKTEIQVQEEIFKNITQNSTNKSSVLMNLQNSINSRLIIFKFDEQNLMLQESLNFTESNSNGGIKYTFMPIATNLGIMFYFDPPGTQHLLSKEKSLFFKNDISKARNKNIYKNIKQIREERRKFVGSKNPGNFQEIERLNALFQMTELGKYYDENDEYIYEVLKESKEVADICNAMALVHSKNQIIIYQNDEDIENAEKQIKKRNIIRIEEYQ